MDCVSFLLFLWLCSFQCMWLCSYSCACLSSGFSSIAVPAFALIMWLQGLCKGIYVGGRTVFIWIKGNPFQSPFLFFFSFFLICLRSLQKSGFLLDLIAMHLSQNGQWTTNLGSNTWFFIFIFLAPYNCASWLTVFGFWHINGDYKSKCPLWRKKVCCWWVFEVSKLHPLCAYVSLFPLFSWSSIQPRKTW